MLAGTIWVFGYTLKLSETTLSGKLFWLNIEYIGIISLPIIWLAYVLWYSGRKTWLSRRVFLLIGGVGGIIQFLVLTDGWHHLIYRETALTTAPGFVVFAPTYGPGFWVYMCFAYLLLFVSMGMLLNTLFQTQGIFRWQVGVLLLFSTIPGVAGLLYVTGYNPFPGLNIAALSTIVTAVGGAISLVRFRWMDVTPIARGRVFEAVRDAVFVLDSAYRIVDLNASALDIVTQSRQRIITKPLGEVVPELDSVTAQSETGRAEEVSIETGSGERVFEVTLSEMTDIPGREAGYTLLLHDITARTQAMTALRNRTEKIEQLHFVARDLISAHTREDIFQMATDTAADLLDCDVAYLISIGGETPQIEASTTDATDVVVMGLVEHLVTEHRDDIDDIHVFNDVLDTRAATADSSHAQGSPGTHSTSGGGDNQAGGDEGQIAYRSVLHAPVGDDHVLLAAGSDPGAFDHTDQDLIELLLVQTEAVLDRLASEADLRAERDRLDEFASIISHDLRNPLNVAHGQVELARAEAESDHLDSIQNALDRMDALIDDLLTLAREGKHVETTEPVDLASVVSGCWRTVATADATLQVKTEQIIEADASRLKQLLENLIRNAVEHGGDDVTVTVGDVEDGFYVADDGPGIPEEDREMVFDAGYSSRQEGTGFGLNIVEQIAVAHGWEISVTASEAGGARFEVTGVDPDPDQR